MSIKPKSIKPTETVDPVLLIQRLEEQKQALLGDIKKKLLKQLLEAAQTYSILTTMGEFDCLKEPAYAEVNQQLHITLEIPKVINYQKSTNRKPRLDFAIRDWLAKEGTKKVEDVVNNFSDEGADKVKEVIRKRSAGSRPIFKVDNNNVSAVI